MLLGSFGAGLRSCARDGTSDCVRSVGVGMLGGEEVPFRRRKDIGDGEWACWGSGRLSDVLDRRSRRRKRLMAL